MSENAITVLNKMQLNQDKQCLMWVNARDYFEKFTGTTVNLYSQKED